MKDLLLFFKQNDHQNKKKVSLFGPSFTQENNNNINSNRNILLQLFRMQWFRLLLILFSILLFIGVWNLIGYKLTLIFFTILPLFIGFGFSYLLEPVDEFFQRFFSKRTSKVIVFFSFLIITLLICIGLFVLVFIQLNNLYYQLFGKTFKKFTALLEVEDASKINGLKLEWIENNKFKLQYSLNVSGQTQNFNYSFFKVILPTENANPKDQLAGIYILFLEIWSKIEIFKSICFSIMVWINKNLSNYQYFHYLFENWKIFVLFLYLFFFTIIIAAYSLGRGKIFFKTIWKFLTKNQKKSVADKLEIHLKKNLSAWGKGLLIVEIYILMGTGIVIFLSGIIFPFSSYLPLTALLALFMMIFNLIPYIGPSIGFIPIIGIGIIDAINNNVGIIISWVPFIISVLGCFLVQVGESAFISPLVYSRKVKLDPITIIVSLALCSVIFGYVLTPLTIPTILIIKIIYNVLKEKEILDEKIPQTRSKALKHDKIN